MKVELIYEKTCPNIEAARAQLLRAFSDAGMTPRWQEWEVRSPQVPTQVHEYGSPPYWSMVVMFMKDKTVASRAAALGVRSVPAVAINGKLAGCCVNRGVDEDELRAAGIGQPLTS